MTDPGSKIERLENRLQQTFCASVSFSLDSRMGQQFGQSQIENYRPAFFMKQLIVFSYRYACNKIELVSRNSKVHTYIYRFETWFSDTRRNGPRILEAQNSCEDYQDISQSTSDCILPGHIQHIG